MISIISNSDNPQGITALKKQKTLLKYNKKQQFQIIM